MTKDKNLLLKKWKDKITLLGKRIKVENNGKIYYGKAVDISEKGRLVICTQSGELIKFWAGDTSIDK